MAYTGNPEDKDGDNDSEFKERKNPDPASTNNDAIIDSKVFSNDDPLYNTQVLHHALLRSSMRIKKGNVDNYIEHYDALWCKFREIGIYNLTHYSKA